MITSNAALKESSQDMRRGQKAGRADIMAMLEVTMIMLSAASMLTGLQCALSVAMGEVSLHLDWLKSRHSL